MEKLSREQMRKVFGGGNSISSTGCRSDNDCGSSEECCPDESNPNGMGFKCQRHSYLTLPNGDVTPSFCGGTFIDV